MENSINPLTYTLQTVKKCNNVDATPDVVEKNSFTGGVQGADEQLLAHAEKRVGGGGVNIKYTLRSHTYT